MSPSLVCVPGVTKCVALGSYVKGCDLLSVQHCLLWHVPQNGVYLLCHERRFGVRVCSVASQFVCAVAVCVVFDGGCWWADVPKMQQRKGGAARAVGDVPCWHSLQHQRAAWMLALSQIQSAAAQQLLMHVHVEQGVVPGWPQWPACWGKQDSLWRFGVFNVCVVQHCAGL